MASDGCRQHGLNLGKQTGHNMKLFFLAGSLSSSFEKFEQLDIFFFMCAAPFKIKHLTDFITNVQLEVVRFTRRCFLCPASGH